MKRQKRWFRFGEKTLKLKEQQYEAVRKIVVDNRPQKRYISLILFI